MTGEADDLDDWVKLRDAAGNVLAVFWRGNWSLNAANDDAKGCGARPREEATPRCAASGWEGTTKRAIE